MLTKFETRSVRVKGVAFHPNRPWVLCGLHNGLVQLWDYRMGSSVDRFEEHEGPVRGVDFHHCQPLFVTGGDDYRVKVFNYKLRRCIFTLTGHLDFIRTVQFHREQPWIVSASDDQTLRIWNWQSRMCISVLTGHNHYVMSAQFHPRDDLIVSASLDVTLRVWDISGLRAKKQDSALSLPQDLFGSGDVVVRFILEGHEKGVNFACFHPTRPFIVSGSDDRSVRIWKMDDCRTYELEQLRGHTANVSSVCFFKDFIVSNSEDRTIRVWDLSGRTPIHTFRRDNDRFWVLAAHPDANLLAAGHDAGMVVFKLERERPAHTVHNGVLYFVADRAVRTFNFDTKQDTRRMSLRRHLVPANSISCNPGDPNTCALWYDYDGGLYELFTLPGNSTGDSDVKRGFYTNAVFFAANKFAVLDKTKQIVLRTTSNDVTKVLPQVGETEQIFNGPPGHLLLASRNTVHLFHVAQKAVITEAQAFKPKYVVWEKDYKRCALISKTHVQVFTRSLKPVCQIHEGTRVKSACFDEDRGVLIYATSNHLKYCLPNGDSGTIETLPAPIYLVRCKGDRIWYITRDGKVVDGSLDSTELSFKLALQQEQFREVFRLIQSTRMKGQALVAYLHKHSYPEIAMHFVTDPYVKFNLAVECGTLDIAKETAVELDDHRCWQRLAECAMKYGDIHLANMANLKMNNKHGLALNALLCGRMEFIEELGTRSSDENFAFQQALVTGDAERRVKLLLKGGQLPLAYQLARAHGLEIVDEILEAMPEDVAERVTAVPVRKHLQPPHACTEHTDNWPLLRMQESYISRMLKDKTSMEGGETGETPTATWGDDLDLGEEDGEVDPFAEAEDGEAEETASPKVGGAWDDLDDLDLGDVELPESKASKDGIFIVPREGEAMERHWAELSQLPAHHIAAGSFETAIGLLRRQCGVVKLEPLKQHFMNTWAACHGCIQPWSAAPPLIFQLANAAETSFDSRMKHQPKLPSVLPVVKDRLKAGHAATTEGKFGDALKIFQSILHQIMVGVVTTHAELRELKDIISVAREYAMALNVELARKEEKDPKRALELAAYFTHFKLQSNHLSLVLYQVMTLAYKQKNIKSAGSFARRLLEHDVPADRADKARKVVALSEKNPKDEVALEYDEFNPFSLCCVSMKPMYGGTASPVRCAYCYAPANPNFRGQTCTVCLVSELGGDASGMMCCLESLS